MEIKNVANLRQAMRESKNIYPGGYAFAFLCADGGELCRRCVKNNIRAIIESVSEKLRDGWFVIGVDSCANLVAPVICDNCDKILLDLGD